MRATARCPSTRRRPCASVCAPGWATARYSPSSSWRRLPRSLLVSRPDVLRRFCLQGDPENYGCEARVAAIIARETGTPLAAVGKRPWPATTLLPRRWPSKEDKQALVATAEGE